MTDSERLKILQRTINKMARRMRLMEVILKQNDIFIPKEPEYDLIDDNGLPIA